MTLAVLLLVFALTGAHISGGMYGSYYHERLNTPEGDKAEHWFVINAVVFLVDGAVLLVWGAIALLGSLA
jgi:hypothetical protein